MTREETIKALADFSTPELCNGIGLYLSMHHEIRHFVWKSKIIGTALTVDVTSGEGGIIADAINIPVSCGGVSVNPGDFIIASCNGI